MAVDTMRPVARRHRYAVIIAGGAGSRFWPLSRKQRPKQFLNLVGNASMLAQTVARLGRSVLPQNILVSTGRYYRKAVMEALPWLPAASVLGEPVGRNTAPCIGWAALELLHRDPQAVMAVLPADHVIGRPGEFRRLLLDGFSLAETSGALVTFGIKPDQAATGYGYIKAGGSIAGTEGARKVAGFYEKPTIAKATRYLKNGNYYWNSGMFVWRADRIIEEINVHAPPLGRALARLEKQRRRGRIPQKALQNLYPRMPNISVDYAIMEKASRVAVIPAELDWSDVGSWDVVGSLWPRDKAGNARRGGVVVAVDSRNNVIESRARVVALVGVEGLAIVDTGDALLVCRRDRSQDVRQVVERLRKDGLEELL
ncbi:MAG: mannose-1-phosphate guanylyltransferase [Deltaproteobacteria bacterium]